MAHAQEFEKMRPVMEKAAERILSAIKSGQRIILKHHNDCDGFSSGLALEAAIIPLIKRFNDKRNAAQEKYRRMPSFSPYYHIEDMMKDCAQFMTISGRFNEAYPLVILTDLGSGPENVLPLQQLKALGCEVIIVDHHPVDPEVDKLVDYHINPHLFSLPNELSAGILCAELARMITNVPEQKMKTLAAVSAISDRVPDEYAQSYIENAQFDKEKLTQIARAVDFVVYHLRAIDAGELLDIVYGSNIEMQDKLLALYTAELKRRELIVLEQAMPLVTIEKIGNTHVATVPVDQLNIKDNYPRMGIIVDIVKEELVKQGKLTAPFVFFGTTPILQLCRASDDSAFDFPTLLTTVKTGVPLSYAEGGGHPHAGTFRYIETQKEPVKECIRKYIESL